MKHSETRAALQERPPPPPPLFTVLAEEGAATEPEIVEAAGYAVSVGLPDGRARRELDALLDRVQASDPALFLDLEAAVNDFELETAERAYVIGYALARTWTGRIADLVEWPQRARAYANLTNDEQLQGAEAAPHGGEPFEGETIADLVERSG